MLDEEHHTLMLDEEHHTLMHVIIHYMVQYQYDAMHQQWFRQQSCDTML
jgi:hypothetical protein